MNKKQIAYKRNIEKTEKIIEDLQKEYDQLPQDKKWNWGLQARISAKVQLELYVSERKAKEYIKLVKLKQRHFNG